MTTETIQPQPEMGPAPDNGQAPQAPTQGHRRRRRRRKNRSNQQNAQQGQQPQMQQQPAPQQPQQQAPQPPHQRHAQHHQNNQPRKKKKFFQKGSGPQAQPGNNVGGSAQGKRKGKQRGPREFVGPMDHSYRAVNGNVADGPPSTIQMMSSNHGHGGGYHADVYSVPPTPVREGAPTRIFCFIEDLFFQAKISETARKLGIKVEFIKGDKESVARLLELPENERPALIVFDLNNTNAKPMILIPKLRTKLKKATSIVGFLNHLQGDLKLKAVEAGCDTVMPRSAFSQSLPNLLRRYGVEEEEEYAQQPM
jgi:hypothetical protein